jgi:hypothetical protein
VWQTDVVVPERIIVKNRKSFHPEVVINCWQNFGIEKIIDLKNSVENIHTHMPKINYK